MEHQKNTKGTHHKIIKHDFVICSLHKDIFANKPCQLLMTIKSVYQRGTQLVKFAQNGCGFSVLLERYLLPESALHLKEVLVSKIV